MSTSTPSLVRWSAFALVLGGIISIGRTILHPDETVPGALVNPLWTPVHIAAAISFMLLAFGLVGLYVWQARASGNFGFIAFALAFFGSVILVALTLDEAFFIHDIAIHNSSVQTLSDFFASADPDLRGYSLIFSGGGFIYLVGYTLMGVAIARAGVFPRWAGWALAFGSVLSFGTAFGFILIRVIGGVLYGIAFAYLGVALWRLQQNASNDKQTS